MKLAELQTALSSEEKIDKDAFSILSAISEYVNDPERENQGRDLVLRALEKKGFFHEFQEVLDALVRKVGLFPYLADEEKLTFSDALAYQYHRPREEADFVFHRAQAEIFRRLTSGDSVILSAPTSFGKSRLIDELIETEKYRNIAIVVPTIALIDETRQRLSAFRGRYKVVSQISQRPESRNIFVFTAERLNAYEELPEIDFFVIDEFYKIGAWGQDEARTIALNQAFYKLQKQGGQFYMLGPNIDQIPKGLEDRFKCFFYPTAFTTVASEIVRVQYSGNPLDRLATLAADIDGQTLIYCRSPKRVNDVVSTLIEANVGAAPGVFDSAIQWISHAYHPDWIFQKGLAAGVGMHHGRLPRSLSQYAVREFNNGNLKFLACTSTLIEGVNTSAKNVIVLDDSVGRVHNKFDFFTFNNIRGRSGRMFQHFVGRVYLFNEAPQEELPFVDFPIFSQGPEVPESLLIQLDESDLTPRSIDRLSGVMDQKDLSLRTIRQNSGIDPELQVDLAKRLGQLTREGANSFLWKGLPDYGQRLVVCREVWRLSGASWRAGVNSAKQLAFKVNQLQIKSDIRSRIMAELEPGQYQAKDPNDAVERVLDFDRNWAGFHFPNLLMALSRIQAEIFLKRFGVCGDYSFYASRVESLFLGHVAVALEEYGLPMQISSKLQNRISLDQDLDYALDEYRSLDVGNLSLDEFEASLVAHLQSHI